MEGTVCPGDGGAEGTYLGLEGVAPQRKPLSPCLRRGSMEAGCGENLVQMF